MAEISHIFEETYKSCLSSTSPVGIYQLKVNDRNSRTRCEICLNLTIKTSFSIVNFEHVNADWEIAVKQVLARATTDKCSLKQ